MAISLPDGTITLNTKITTATGTEPSSISSRTPPIMVLASVVPNWSVYMMG